MRHRYPLSLSYRLIYVFYTIKNCSLYDIITNKCIGHMQSQESVRSVNFTETLLNPQLILETKLFWETLNLSRLLVSIITVNIALCLRVDIQGPYQLHAKFCLKCFFNRTLRVKNWQFLYYEGVQYRHCVCSDYSGRVILSICCCNII